MATCYHTHMLCDQIEGRENKTFMARGGHGLLKPGAAMPIPSRSYRQVTPKTVV
jgi:hypothetical protein